MSDEKGTDDKIIAVHVDDPEYVHYHDAGDLPPHRLKEIQRFFLDYKVLEQRTVDVESRSSVTRCGCIASGSHPPSPGGAGAHPNSPKSRPF